MCNSQCEPMVIAAICKKGRLLNRTYIKYYFLQQLRRKFSFVYYLSATKGILRIRSRIFLLSNRNRTFYPGVAKKPVWNICQKVILQYWTRSSHAGPNLGLARQIKYSENSVATICRPGYVQIPAFHNNKK